MKKGRRGIGSDSPLAVFLESVKSQFVTTLLAPLLLGAGLGFVYLTSMAPGLTWANSGSDGGDLIAAAATGGVAHPTGYPVYLLLAGLFQQLPIGSLAFRTNLLSGLSTVGAALVVYAIVRREAQRSGLAGATWAGLVGGVALGLAPLIWSQAVITEVYSLNLLFMALLLYLLTLPAGRYLAQNGLIGLVQGLGVGNHVLAVLMVPATLLGVSMPDDAAHGEVGTRFWSGWRLELAALAQACAGLLVGILIYVILPFRAASNPAINWGDPVTPKGFIWLVTGRLYQAEFLHYDFGIAWTHVQGLANLTLQQFGWIGLIAALSGLIFFFVPSRLHILTLWLALANTVFAIQYQTIDSYVYLLPAYLACSIWIGTSIAGAAHLLSPHASLAAPLIGLFFLAYLAALGFQHRTQVDASQDRRAEAYGHSVMTSAPQRALLFAQGDQAVFTLWYFHYALHERQDVAVIATDLLPFDWYRENLRHTYPDLALPASTQMPWILAIRQSNAQRPACYPYYLEPDLNCQ